MFMSIILGTAAIDTDGTIDGIEPSNIITLDQDQHIPVETTFNVLQVMKKLEVNGTIAGKELDEFLPNPTLTMSKEIPAACSFRDLVVQGKVTVENSWNGLKLEKMLADVVYETKDDIVVSIKAPKIFKNLEVKDDIAITSNFINDMNLDSILMTDRDQFVTFDKLHGEVSFKNLRLSGLFDGINATELEHNSVRTFGDQFIEAPLLFAKSFRTGAKSADIKKQLNQVPVEDYIFVDQPVNLPISAVFSDLDVGELLSGDVVGTGRFSSFNMSDLATNYLSKTRHQRILVPAHIKSLSTNGTFHSKSINGIEFEVFRKFMRSIKNFKTLILSGEQRIDNLIIDGSVNVKTINDRDFNKIIQSVIWLNRPNSINGNLKFLDDVTVSGALTVQGNLNDKLFKSWVEGWISNKETSIVLQSDKKFASDVVVEESLKAETINGIKFENLLLVKDALRLPLLNVYGNINTEKLAVKGICNGHQMKILEDIYSYDAETYSHIINSNVRFNQPATVQYLNTPVLNKLNVSAWMANLIRSNENDINIFGEKTFTNQFVANEGFYCKFFNDINLEFLDHVVLANGQSIVNIQGDLSFANDVYSQLVALSSDLYTRYVSSCDLKEWVHQALPIHQDVNYNGEFRF